MIVFCYFLNNKSSFSRLESSKGRSFFSCLDSCGTLRVRKENKKIFRFNDTQKILSNENEGYYLKQCFSNFNYSEYQFVNEFLNYFYEEKTVNVSYTLTIKKSKPAIRLLNPIKYILFHFFYELNKNLIKEIVY